MKWAEKNSNLKIIRIPSRIHDSGQLESILDEYHSNENVLIGGEINHPKNIPDDAKGAFYNEVIRHADYKFALLRNPIDRFNSCLHYTNSVASNAEDCDEYGLFIHDIPETKTMLNQIGLFSASRENAKKSLEEALRQVIFPYAFTNFPFNNRLRAFINDYPILLGVVGENEYLLPLPLRSNLTNGDSINSHIRLLQGKACDIRATCGVAVSYSLFAIEDTAHLVSSLVKRGIIAENPNPFPHENTTSKNKDFDIKSVDSRIIAECCCQYPESFTLWKLAIMRAFN